MAYDSIAQKQITVYLLSGNEIQTNFIVSIKGQIYFFYKVVNTFNFSENN